MSILLKYKLYLNEENCKKHNKTFMGKSDIEFSNETIIKCYLNRWNIETNYKYIEPHLGFDEYEVQGIFSIERYSLLTCLAINFLEIYRLYYLEELKTIGDTIKYIKSAAAKELVYFVYEQAKNNIPIETVLAELKLAS